MKKTYFWLGFAVFLGLLVGVGAGAEKVVTDKQRIASLEKQVSALNEVVSSLDANFNGNDNWPDSVNMAISILNDRTINLNERLKVQESKGPVAELHK